MNIKEHLDRVFGEVRAQKAPAGKPAQNTHIGAMRELAATTRTSALGAAVSVDDYQRSLSDLRRVPPVTAGPDIQRAAAQAAVETLPVAVVHVPTGSLEAKSGGEVAGGSKTIGGSNSSEP
jgi:hypothetical protein